MAEEESILATHTNTKQYREEQSMAEESWHEVCVVS